MTDRRRRTSSADRPLAGGVDVLGRCSLSQGLLTTRSMRCRNRKNDDRQAMRAPMVTGEGSLAGDTFAVGPDEHLLHGHLVRGLAEPAEEVLEHAGVALHGAV